MGIARADATESSDSTSDVSNTNVNGKTNDEDTEKDSRRITTAAKDSPLPLMDSCDRSDENKLLSRLKDSGLYAEIYMAPDLETAADHFPNLNDPSRFTMLKGEYFCDSDCQHHARFVRSVMMRVNRKSQMRHSSSRGYAHSETESWWHEENWNVEQHWRERRHLDSSKADHIDDSNAPLVQNTTVFLSSDGGEFNGTLKSYGPTNFNDEKQIEASLKNAKTFQKEKEKHQKTDSPEVRQIKRKRNVDKTSTLELINSGTSKGIIGTTVAIECDSASDESLSMDGYHMCKTCRAVRQLPEGYFPRIINEVICAEDSCLHGEGTCRQRFLPFKILRNYGNKSCAKWRLFSIDIRTCCDCIVHSNSPFVKYVI